MPYTFKDLSSICTNRWCIKGFSICIAERCLLAPIEISGIRDYEAWGHKDKPCVIEIGHFSKANV